MSVHDREVIRGAEKPEKRTYLQVTYFYADTRMNALSFAAGEAFLIDEGNGGALHVGGDTNRGDRILTCDGGAIISVRPNWLWREEIYVKRDPVKFATGPEGD